MANVNNKAIDFIIPRFRNSYSDPKHPSDLMNVLQISLDRGPRGRWYTTAANNISLIIAYKLSE